MGQGETRQAGWVTEEELHQQVKRGEQGEDEGVEGEEEGVEGEVEEQQDEEKGTHGVQGAAHLTHMLPNSHEYRLHEARGTPRSVGDLDRIGVRSGEIRERSSETMERSVEIRVRTR